MKATWVNASAGTGKTKALKDHCLNLLDQGVKPQHILCITFTNNAVQEMKERIHNPNVAVSTLHSVAQEVIQKAKGITISHILDEYDQEQLLRKASHLYFTENRLAAKELSAHYSYEYFLSLLKKIIYKTREPMNTLTIPLCEKPTIEYCDEYCLQFLTAKGTLRKKISKEQNEAQQEEAQKVYDYVQSKKIYEWMHKNQLFLNHMNGILRHYLAIKKGYDFHDLILEATKLLDNEIHLFETTQFFHHILLDEAQDTSFFQWRLFRRLIENALSVFIVGDNKQNIYSFQEARPEFFEAFKQELKHISDFEEKTLTTNYRSLEKIVRHATQTCQTLNIPEQKVFRTEEGVFDVITSYESIVDLLASKTILPSTKCPIEPKDILLLFRKRDEIFESVFDFLTKQNIPVQKEQKYYLQEDPIVKDIMHFLNLQIYPYDAYEAFYCERSLLNTKLKEKGLSMFFQEIHHFMAALWDIIPSYLLEALIDIFVKLQAPTFYTLRDYLQKHPAPYEKPLEQNAITMMTIHGSKGLQSPVVYLFETSSKKPYDPFLYDIKTNSLYMMPPADIYHPSIVALREHYKKMADDEMERLLYVAITRACDHFYFVRKAVLKTL